MIPSVHCFAASRSSGKMRPWPLDTAGLAPPCMACGLLLPMHLSYLPPGSGNHPPGVCCLHARHLALMLLMSTVRKLFFGYLRYAHLLCFCFLPISSLKRALPASFSRSLTRGVLFLQIQWHARGFVAQGRIGQAVVARHHQNSCLGSLEAQGDHLVVHHAYSNWPSAIGIARIQIRVVSSFSLPHSLLLLVGLTRTCGHVGSDPKP